MLTKQLTIAMLTVATCSAGLCPAQEAGTDIDPVPRLLKNLQADSVKVAASAAKSLGVIFSPGGKARDDRDAVIEVLITKLDAKQGGLLRKETATALGNIRAKAAVEPLKEALNDKDIEAAVEAGKAIAKILPVDAARDYLKAQAPDASESVLVAVHSAMATIAKAEDAEFLLAGLPSENWRIQQAIVQGVERSARAGARLQPDDYEKLAGVLGSEILNASNAAVHFFQHIRNTDSTAAVLNAADTHGDGSETDESWRMRTYALRTIWNWGWPSNQEALPYVIRNLGDRTVNVTNEARRILNGLRKDQHIGQAELYPLLLTELEKAESLKTRAGIMREWGGNVDRQFASRVAAVASKTLTESMEQPKEWSARAYSVKLLGASGFTGAIETIAECVSDDTSNVRQAAGKSLEQLAPLASEDELAAVSPILQPLLEKPVDWRKTAIAARATGYYPSEAAIQPLIGLLSHSVLNARDASSFALARVARTNPELKAKIEAPLFAEISEVSGSWQYGARVLGALQNPKAVPLLTTILSKGDWRSQESAARAVKEIAAVAAIEDDALNQALIGAAQSEVVQVQDAANLALRAVAKKEE
jgi:HEAT repeat protein